MDIAKLHAEGRKFRSKQGNAVRVICADRFGRFPVVYLKDSEGFGEILLTCGNDGDGCIEPIPIEREGWVVVSKQKDMHQPIFGSIASAVAYATPGERVARITWEE